MSGLVVRQLVATLGGMSRTLLTCLVLLSVFSVSAQNFAVENHPWNPDANNDNVIGTDDLLGLLSQFGNEWNTTPPPCPYDGSDLENLLLGIASGTVILDSMFIEFELETVAEYYLTGCPELQIDTVVFSNHVMLHPPVVNAGLQSFWSISSNDPYGFGMWFYLGFDQATNLYDIIMVSHAVGNLGLEEYFGSSYAHTISTTLPFPDDWFLDESGIHIESGWDEHDWPFYANYFHILPYWHHAE